MRIRTMEKITYGELKALFLRHEGTRPEKHLTGCIVFTEDSFEKPYSWNPVATSSPATTRHTAPAWAGTASSHTTWTAATRTSAWRRTWPRNAAERTAGGWSIAT